MSHYIQKLSENVERKHVRYQNRYGIAIAGDLYTAKGMDQKKRYPALIVGAPYGGVKEQGPCVYANELAQRGFVVLTFDPCYMGESGGEPRRVSSPDLFTENFSAGVDYLGLQEFVDREKIGVIGICGSGGFALSAAQVDTRTHFPDRDGWMPKTDTRNIFLHFRKNLLMRHRREWQNRTGSGSVFMR